MKTAKQVVKERRRSAEFFSKAQRIDELLAEVKDVKTPPNTPRDEESKPQHHSVKPQKQ